MSILNSTWFLTMLKKSGGTPSQRLLRLFDIIGDWMDAPHMREVLAQSQPEQMSAAENLLSYLTQQAKGCGAAAPEMLAQQLYFMAAGTLQEELRTPGCGAIAHAKQAAQALIHVQTKNERYISQPALISLVASLFVAVGVCSLWISGGFGLPIAAPQARPAAQVQSLPMAQSTGDPAQLASTLAMIEQMRQGVCQYPEALAIPENQRAVYLENVVGGQAISSAEDQALVTQLLQKVHCSYTPRLMANSTG